MTNWKRVPGLFLRLTDRIDGLSLSCPRFLSFLICSKKKEVTTMPSSPWSPAGVLTIVSLVALCSLSFIVVLGSDNIVNTQVRDTVYSYPKRDAPHHRRVFHHARVPVPQASAPPASDAPQSVPPAATPTPVEPSSPKQTPSSPNTTKQPPSAPSPSPAPSSSAAPASQPAQSSSPPSAPSSAAPSSSATPVAPASTSTPTAGAATTSNSAASLSQDASSYVPFPFFCVVAHH